MLIRDPNKEIATDSPLRLCVAATAERGRRIFAMTILYKLNQEQ